MLDVTIHTKLHDELLSNGTVYIITEVNFIAIFLPHFDRNQYSVKAF